MKDSLSGSTDLLVNAARQALGQVVFSKPGYAQTLAEELADRQGLVSRCLTEETLQIEVGRPIGDVEATVFARQVMPGAFSLPMETTHKAAQVLLREAMGAADASSGKWTIHAFGPSEGADATVGRRATNIAEALLSLVQKRMPRLFKRYEEPQVFAHGERHPEDVIVQLYLPRIDALWASAASLREGVSRWPGGIRRMRELAGAPSRSYLKLEEAFVLMACRPKPGDIAVDLGAAPGGWSFALAHAGAQVLAVDNGPMKIAEALPEWQSIRHLREDGLSFAPNERPVDWLTCDMVIRPQDTLRVLSAWLAEKRMRHFVVNLKLPQAKPWPLVREARQLLEGLPYGLARHLYHDRHEITLMGSLERG